MTLPAARASGDASAASSSARSAATEPRRALTSAASRSDRSPPRWAGRSSRRGRSSRARAATDRDPWRGRHDPLAEGDPLAARAASRGAASPPRAGRPVARRTASVGRHDAEVDHRGAGLGRGLDRTARSVAAILAWGWCREGPRGGRLALWRRSSELGARGGQDSRRLGAHAEDAAAARGEDLEVEVVEARVEGLTRLAQRLLDRLAGELSVGAHRISAFMFNVVSHVDPAGRAGGWLPPRMRTGRGTTVQSWFARALPPHASWWMSAPRLRRPGSAGYGPRRSRGSSRRSGTSRPSR